MSDFHKVAEKLMSLVPEELPVEESDPVRDKERRYRILAAAGVPRRVMRSLDGELRPTRALTAARDFAGGILALAGRAGCGKTVGATAWLWSRLSDAAADRVPRCFVTAFDLERMSRYNDRDVRELVLARALVVDDLGTEYLDAKGNFSSFLNGLLCARWSEERDTVIATNLDAGEFKSNYGERLADRIRECGRFVSISEPSLRRKTEGGA